MTLPQLPPPQCKECHLCGFGEHPGMTCDEYAKEYLNSYTVYLIQSRNHYKIGWTRTNTMRRRLHNLRVGNPHALKLVHEILVTGKFGAQQYEAMLHQRFSDKRVRGEWFALTRSDVVWLCAIEPSFGAPSSIEQIEAQVARSQLDDALCKPFLGRRVRHKEYGCTGKVEAQEHGSLIVLFQTPEGPWRTWCSPDELERFQITP